MHVEILEVNTMGYTVIDANRCMRQARNPEKEKKQWISRIKHHNAPSRTSFERDDGIPALETGVRSWPP